ncbi:MAG: glycine betaine/L-proline ABC transporter ATP-binding protein [Desulfobulbaceae bacterium]|jgi:glycine betaine/proline transport system ATP-binding protein|nr:glycine betaine/L-proline ABC transporter ATP-binding protein [Desulfobulbaceae bacterium]
MDEIKDKIKIKNVTKVFGKHPEKALKLLDEGMSKDEIFQKTGQAVGLNNVNFNVREGEILVVMGLSGSGKSTLIRCVNRLIEPTAGSTIIDDVDVNKLTIDELRNLRRRKFGMVFQNFGLFPHRTVLANTEFGLEIQNVDPAERQKKAMDALNLVGLEGWEDADIAQLSGGMQQRVGLARALAVDPDILLMDEAFSALDPMIRRDMQHELITLQERMKKTILFVSHDLDEALKIGDRIVLMKDGRVIQIGTGEEILTNPSTEYVKRFVESVDRTQLLTAKSIMNKARAVGYPKDGPRTVLRRMRDEGLSSLYVVQRDYTLLGIVTADAAKKAIDDNKNTIADIIDKDIPHVKGDELLSVVITILAERQLALPVVDENEKLLGVVVKGSVLSALAE